LSCGSICSYLFSGAYRTVCYGSSSVRALPCIIVSSSLPFWPWQQRFFPAEIMFFALGMLSFRRSSEILNFVDNGRACLMIVSALVICAGWLQPIAFPWGAQPESATLWPSSVFLGAVFYLTLPAMSLTSRSHIDRLIGEFSYPIYLVHVTVWYFVEPRILIVACIAASAPLVLFVELPLERWRNNRLRYCHKGRYAVS
jgi:peptidoglycan/LPS O-acetylase OafA/YrhL